MVRSHEQKRNGYSIQHDGQLITVFSAPSYCLDTNLGAVLIITRDDEGQSHLRFHQFSGSPFPYSKMYMPTEPKDYILLNLALQKRQTSQASSSSNTQTTTTAVQQRPSPPEGQTTTTETSQHGD